MEWTWFGTFLKTSNYFKGISGENITSSEKKLQFYSNQFIVILIDKIVF